MEELLKEVVLSERRKRQIDSFIQTITELLQTVPHSPEVEVCVWDIHVTLTICNTVFEAQEFRKM